MDTARLPVFATLFNPLRFRSRLARFTEWRQHMEATPGVDVHVAEVAFGDRPFVITEAGNPKHLQLRTASEIWHKERALNLLIERTLPPDAKALAICDTDIQFQRRDWAAETLRQLEHYPVVQMFTHAVDLGPRGEILDKPRLGFAYQHHRQLKGETPLPEPGMRYSAGWHPGYAWAMTRQAYDRLGGLLDICIVGSADYHMAMGLIGKGAVSIDEHSGTFSDGYRDAIMRWCDNARLRLRRDIGYVEGTLLHLFHGPKAKRGYGYRESILIKNQFCPNRHLILDPSGLYALDDPSGEIRDRIRFYLRARDDDSTATS